MDRSNSPHLEYVELLLEKTLGDKVLAKTLFEKLFTTLPDQLEYLAITLSKKDISEAKQMTHDIQGVFGNCGLINLEYFAQKINTYLSVKDLQSARKYSRILQVQVSDFIACEEKILAALEE
jgi:HPt (histidine-containing phosphotransfer) domain-containing protein